MRASRSAARLARGLRGFASKKRPDFYKPAAGPASADTGAAAKNPASQPAAEGAGGASAAAKAAGGQPAAPPSTATPAAAPAAASSSTAAPSAAAAPKPTPPVTPPAASAAAAPKPPAPPAAAAPKPAAPAPPVKPAPAAATPAAKPAAPAASPAAAAPAAKPAAPAAAAAKPAGPAAAAPKPAAPAAKAAPAAAVGAPPGGAAGAGGAGGGNGWLLHPSVPVDVRLLGAGLLGAGYLLYSFSGGDAGSQPPAPRDEAVVVEESGFVMQPEGDSSAAAAGEAPPAVDAAADAAAAEAAAEAAAAEAAAAAGAEQGQAAAGGEPEEPPIYVDASKVLGVIEEVFSKEASEQLQALEAQAAAEAAQAAAASEDKVAAAGRDAAAGKPQAPPPPPAGGEAAGEAKPASNKKASASAARRAEEDVAAIQSAMADQAGESVASEFVQSKPHMPAPSRRVQGGGKREQAEEAAEPAKPAPPPESEALARARKVLGLGQDLSAAGLIGEAVRLGLGPAEDFSDYEQRHRQAEADAVVLARLIEAAGSHVAAQLAAAARDAEAGLAEAAAARRQLAEQGESFRVVLREALARAEEQQRQQLRRQAEQLTVAHAEMTLRERAERAAKLDGVREKLNALETAFKRRSVEQRTSHEAHQLSLGVFGLLEALQAGRPLGGPLALLGPLAAQDPVVKAAVQAVPAEASAAPVPTRAQLSERFDEVAGLARALSMLPEGRGGMLSVAVAKLAAKLKVAERGPLAAAMPGDGIDRRLAAAQQAVLDGELLAAASQLESAVAGTAAAPVVAGWARQVRLRALAEQSAALLEAHAAAETASLA